MGLTTSMQRTSLIPALDQFNQFLGQEAQRQKEEDDKQKTSMVGQEIINTFSQLGNNASIEQVNNATKYALGLSSKYNTPDALKVLDPLMQMQAKSYGEQQNMLMAKNLAGDYPDQFKPMDFNGLSGSSALEMVKNTLSQFKTVTTKPTTTKGSTLTTYDKTGKVVGTPLELGGGSLTDEKTMEASLYMQKEKFSSALQLNNRLTEIKAEQEGRVKNLKPYGVTPDGIKTFIQSGIVVYPSNGMMLPATDDMISKSTPVPNAGNIDAAKKQKAQDDNRSIASYNDLSRKTVTKNDKLETEFENSEVYQAKVKSNNKITDKDYSDFLENYSNKGKLPSYLSTDQHNAWWNAKDKAENINSGRRSFALPSGPIKVNNWSK